MVLLPSSDEKGSSLLNRSRYLLRECLKGLEDSNAEMFKMLLTRLYPAVVSFLSLFKCYILMSDTPLIYSLLAIPCYCIYGVIRICSSNFTIFLWNVWPHISITAADSEGHSSNVHEGIDDKFYSFLFARATGGTGEIW